MQTFGGGHTYRHLIGINKFDIRLRAQTAIEGEASGNKTNHFGLTNN